MQSPLSVNKKLNVGSIFVRRQAEPQIHRSGCNNDCMHRYCVTEAFFVNRQNKPVQMPSPPMNPDETSCLASGNPLATSASVVRSIKFATKLRASKKTRRKRQTDSCEQRL